MIKKIIEIIKKIYKGLFILFRFFSIMKIRIANFIENFFWNKLYSDSYFIKEPDFSNKDKILIWFYLFPYFFFFFYTLFYFLRTIISVINYACKIYSSNHHLLSSEWWAYIIFIVLLFLIYLLLMKANKVKPISNKEKKEYYKNNDKKSLNQLIVFNKLVEFLNPYISIIVGLVMATVISSLFYFLANILSENELEKLIGVFFYFVSPYISISAFFLYLLYVASLSIFLSFCYIAFRNMLKTKPLILLSGAMIGLSVINYLIFIQHFC